jgi:curved DNA-binding protein CbpA
MSPPPPGPDEDVDLDAETRRYVLELEAKVDSITYYDVLGVERTADRKEIKRAYFKLAATLHPDRHFGKKLGSFKPKMEMLFKKVSDAHDTLSVASKRAEYDARLGAAPQVAQASAVVAPRIPEDRRETERKRLELEEQIKKREEIAAKVKQHVDAATRAKAAGDFAMAAGAYRAAMTLSPDDAELKAAHVQAARAAAEKLAESHERQALLEEKYGRWAAAAASWKRVATARPNDEKVRERLANAMSRAARG